MEAKTLKRAIRSTALMAIVGGTFGISSFGTNDVNLPSGEAQAAPFTCSTAGAAGKYGFELDGWVAGLPLAAVGQLDMDGTGDASFVGFFTIDGDTESVQYYGSVNVNSDCSATLSLHRNDNDIDIRAQFVRNGREMKFLIEDQETTAVGSAIRITSD